MHESRNMIGVGMRRNDNIYGSVIPWHNAGKTPQYRTIRAAIYEDLPPRRGFYEYRIALPDSKERHAQHTRTRRMQRNTPHEYGSSGKQEYRTAEKEKA